MGNGVCSRRQRKIFQCLLLVTVVCGMMYGGMVSYEMHKQLKRTEAMAQKYQQHQESLSAQLQVVYEHRSRLEKSLQKERLEHKKAKEDFLVYKVEAQQSLNKEKQDANGRFNSLHVQHQMLKGQHEDLKKQYYDLHEKHQIEGEDHSRLLDEHRDRYDKLHQAKEVEVSQIKESMYNLREENKQLRKAHHDIHVQLQDAQVHHQDLKAAHDQLALTLEDHKSALAAAQVQVDHYKQLSSLKQSEHQGQLHQAAAVAPVSHVQAEQPAHREEAQIQPEVHPDVVSKVEPDAHVPESHPTVSHQALTEKEEDKEGEAERRRELAEEHMAQAGQPQKLEEDPDQPQDEEEGPVQELPDENAIEQQQQAQRQVPHPDTHVDSQILHVGQDQVKQVKSAYEQQQEQQRLEAQRDQERRQIQQRQDALQADRQRVMIEREKRLREEKEREELHHREADRREQILREEQHRKRSEYENMDNDIVQGEVEHNNNDEEEQDVHMIHEDEEEQENVDHRVYSHQQGAVDLEPNPEDDPNNQGEDEFEEAEDERVQPRGAEEAAVEEEEPAARAQHRDTHPGHDQPVVEEELVMAGNPDQQEDTLDEQYQEEGEDEAQEELAGGGAKREEEVEEEEDPYNEDIEHNIEQDEDKNQEEPRKEGGHHNNNNEEENYEEEEEEVEEDAAGQDKQTHRRAEM